ncbi:helix-turn-helix domain-containing protein [Streptomyces sp. NPDC050704]|uniref:helix-turn-helix domain-containing protein n=1 Tax=Streptomyces sp. NPDC050704 TaxID=3157219 RepID=UPI0034414DDB
METWERGADLAELLRVVRRQGAPVEVLRWLGRRIGADVAWIRSGGGSGSGVGSGGVVEAATPEFPGGLAGALREQLARLADGRLAAATTHVDGLEVRLEAFGGREPRPVLVTVSASELSREAAALASQAGALLALLRQASEAADSARGYEQKARQLRFAVLTALLAGDVTMARRMTTGDVPLLLNAERVRVHVLHCPPADRDRLARTYLDAAGYHGPGLMVHCPAFKEHLICPIAEDPEPVGRFRRGEVQGDVLRRLVRDNPGYAVGVSGPHPLAATADAYGEALHALAVARNSPERLAVYRGRPSLVHLLPRRPALAWARAFLEPLNSVPRPTVDITRLAVTFPRAAVARLLQISRTTVAAHCRRAEEALALDLGDVHARATLDLALSLTGPQPDPEDTGRQAAPPLTELLRAAPAATWAESFLRPLHDTPHRNLRRTVETWIDANTDARRTAGRLGLSRNTVRAHLRAAELLLNRDLLTTASGVHDLVHALTAAAVHRARPTDESGHRARWSAAEVAS